MVGDLNLGVRGVFFSWQEPEKIKSACGTVVSESKLYNFSWQYYYLFKSHGLIRRYIALYFLPPKKVFLLTKYEIRRLVVRQKGVNIHSSVPTSLQYPATNPYTSVVDFMYFRRRVEPALD